MVINVSASASFAGEKVPLAGLYRSLLVLMLAPGGP